MSGPTRRAGSVGGDGRADAGAATLGVSRPGPLDGLLRNIRILAVCWRAAVSEQLEYRADLVAKALTSGFWMAWAAAGVSIYFRFTGDIAGWSYGEVLVVVGLFFSINGIRQAFFEPNLAQMGEYVRRGTLDHVLVQPIGSQLLVSLRRIDLHNLVDPLLGLVLVVIGLVVRGTPPKPGGIAAFLLLFAAAIALLYALVLALMALAILLIGAEELEAVSFSVVELSRFPVQAYRQPLQTLLVVVPVALLTTIPAEALVGRLEWWWLLASPGAAIVTVGLASLGWRRALRRYSGASS